MWSSYIGKDPICCKIIYVIAKGWVIEHRRTIVYSLIKNCIEPAAKITLLQYDFSGVGFMDMNLPFARALL